MRQTIVAMRHSAGELGVRLKRFSQSNLDELSRVRHLVHGLHPLIGWLRENGLEFRTYLEESGIPEDALEDPDYKIMPGQELSFYAAACRELDKADLGLLIGPRYHISSYGMLGLAAMTAPTLYECYQRFFDHIVMTWTYFRFMLYEDGETGVLEMEALRDLGDAYGFMRDRDISAAYYIACEALGKRLPLVRVELKEQSSSYAEAYENVFKCPLAFGAARDAIVFEKAWLDAPLHRADPATSSVFASQCESISSALRNEFSLTEHIRSLVLNLDEAPKSLEEIAGALHSTPRTIQRKLSAAGTSYTELVEEVRTNTAIEYLRSTAMPIEEIGFRVGYADASSFSHAFKRITGKKPSEYRSQQRSSSHDH